MKNIIYLILLVPIFIFGQSKSEKIIDDFKKMSREKGIYVQSPGGEPEPVFQFCEKEKKKILKLDKLINDEELESLKSSDNGTIKFIGYLISAKRNNNKNYVLNLLNSVTEEKKIYMAWGCERNESSFSYQMYLLRVLSVKNSLFEPKYNMTNADLNGLLEKIKNSK
ncbi:hypothetical protein [Kordia zhangzhouensis]|uniref:hypothetical protein n=1 Tax=Kordia zhangzhouensis TaxID=1620405 RepID=UPI0006296976|nr:hypothetical protein [Kordia zhangzhouensis]